MRKLKAQVKVLPYFGVEDLPHFEIPLTKPCGVMQMKWSSENLEKSLVFSQLSLAMDLQLNC